MVVCKDTVKFEVYVMFQLSAVPRIKASAAKNTKASKNIRVEKCFLCRLSERQGKSDKKFRDFIVAFDRTQF